MGQADYLKRGQWNAICDVCGFKFKSAHLMKRWDGLMVCQQDYELRHPQDFLRVSKEKISPPWVRPQSDNIFVTFYLVTQAGDQLVTQDGSNLTTEY